MPEDSQVVLLLSSMYDRIQPSIKLRLELLATNVTMNKAPAEFLTCATRRNSYTRPRSYKASVLYVAAKSDHSTPQDNSPPLG